MQCGHWLTRTAGSAFFSRERLRGFVFRLATTRTSPLMPTRERHWQGCSRRVSRGRFSFWPRSQSPCLLLPGAWGRRGCCPAGSLLTSLHDRNGLLYGLVFLFNDAFVFVFGPGEGYDWQHPGVVQLTFIALVVGEVLAFLLFPFTQEVYYQRTIKRAGQSIPEARMASGVFGCW